MRYTTAGEHTYFFQNHGYIEFEEVIPPEEVSKLQKEIKAFDRDECFTRSIPLISQMIRRWQLNEIVCSLILKKQVRLVYDATKIVSLEENQCGLLVLPNGSVLIFKEPLYKDPEGWYLLLVFEEKQ